MDEPIRQEEPGEQTVTPSEVWERLSPDLQARVVSLLAKMAYKHTIAQLGSPPEEPEEE